MTKKPDQFWNASADRLRSIKERLLEMSLR